MSHGTTSLHRPRQSCLKSRKPQDMYRIDLQAKVVIATLQETIFLLQT